MKKELKFKGFSKKTVAFFKGLEKNNSKEWFDLNRDVYDDYVMGPAIEFVKEMGAQLKSISPNIVADPRRDKSIFRLNRDIRFSNNKIPYKTHLGIYFWEGEGKKLENPGFYFQLDKKNILLAAGMHIFPKHMLTPYREAVTDPIQGEKLIKIISRISKNKSYKLGWPKYKQVPRGFDPGHTNKEYLLYGGIVYIYEEKHPKELLSRKFIDYAFRIFEDLSSIQKWVMEINNL